MSLLGAGYDSEGEESGEDAPTAPLQASLFSVCFSSPLLGLGAHGKRSVWVLLKFSGRPRMPRPVQRA